MARRGTFLVALAASALLAAADPDCLDGACPSDADTSSLLQRATVRQHTFQQQPYPEPPDDGPDPVPNGAQLARNNSLRVINGGGDGCPPPDFAIPSPPDGLGLGYMWLEKELTGEPGRNIPGPPFKSCRTCPTCEFKSRTIYDALLLNYRDGNDTLFSQILSPILKWSVIGYGATTQGCFGHTYVNGTELVNSCYSFGVRIGDIFRPDKIEEIMIDSCGEMAMVRLFCGNCVNTTTRPNPIDYPQRYAWTFNIEDNAAAPQGFYISKIDALLDTELTQYLSLAEYDFDPYVCQAIKGPLSVYPPVPQPAINRVEQEEQDTNTTCSECANCSSTLEVLEPALLAFAKGECGPLRKLLARDVFWFFPGQGPTLAACSAAQDHSSLAPFVGPNGFFFRLMAMTKAQNLVQSQLYLNYCGQKANFIWWSEFTGRSGQMYTLTMSMTMTFAPSKHSKHGWVISQIYQGVDTEVFMNMASREERFDPKRCSKIGAYSQAISRSLVLP